MAGGCLPALRRTGQSVIRVGLADDQALIREGLRYQLALEPDIDGRPGDQRIMGVGCNDHPTRAQTPTQPPPATTTLSRA